MGNTPSLTRCFACGKIIHGREADTPSQADTRDGQTVFVGSECLKKIVRAADAGYQPPTGGPRLYPMPREAVQRA